MKLCTFECGVVAIKVKQFLTAALFNYAAILNNRNAICIAYC